MYDEYAVRDTRVCGEMGAYETEKWFFEIFFKNTSGALAIKKWACPSPHTLSYLSQHIHHTFAIPLNISPTFSSQFTKSSPHIILFHTNYSPTSFSSYFQRNIKITLIIMLSNNTNIFNKIIFYTNV